MKCDCDICYLKNSFLSIFEGAELENYCSAKEERSIQKGEIIIQQGNAITEYMYLKEGLVKLYRDTPDGEQIISFGKPFDYVSLLNVLDKNEYQYSVMALEPSVVCVFKLEIIKNLILANGKFAMSILKNMSQASDRILQNSLDIIQKRLYGRVAHVLLYFADEVYQNDNFDLPVSRKEMASYVGMTVENVVRTISGLRKDKIINVYGKNIQIVDKVKLKLICKNN